MIQSILAEISQKRRIHLYPSLARDESVFPPDAARPNRLSRPSPGAEITPNHAICYCLFPSVPTTNTLKNDNCGRFCNDLLSVAINAQ
jgi:hypothetical protein